MVTTSTRDRTTYTSAPPYKSDTNFRFRIEAEDHEENIGSFEVIQITARVLPEDEVESIDTNILGVDAFKYADEVSVGEDILVTHVSRMSEVPVCQYMPSNTPSRLHAPFTVSRGPDHIGHVFATKIELTAKGYEDSDDARSEDGLGYPFGSARIIVEG